MVSELTAAQSLARYVEDNGDRRRARVIRRRDCDECQACCEQFGVRPELPAPHNEARGACPLLAAAGGCSIYAKRPHACRQYLCGWRAGLGEARHRPDRCGWIVELHVVAGRAQPVQVRFVRVDGEATMDDRDDLARAVQPWLVHLRQRGVREVVTHL